MVEEISFFHSSVGCILNSSDKYLFMYNLIPLIWIRVCGYLINDVIQGDIWILAKQQCLLLLHSGAVVQLCSGWK